MYRKGRRDADTDKEDFRYELWRAYLTVRRFLVWKYLRMRAIVVLNVVFDLLTLTTFIVTNWWNASLQQLELSRIMLAQVIAIVLLWLATLVVTLLAVPAFGIFGGEQVDWPYIKLCNQFFDDHPQAYRDDDTLDAIKMLAETDSGAAWGAVTVLGVFFAIDLAVLTGGIKDQGAFLAWFFAFVLLLGCLLSTLIANAGTVIKHAIVLRRSSPGVASRQKHPSPWFRK